MSTPNKGASVSSGSLPAEYQEIVVKRDGNRPISFAGQVLARVSMSGSIPASSISAALYKTRGGKFVATLSKAVGYIGVFQVIIDSDTTQSGEFNKAQVFDNFDEAVAWFRPGRLTDALRKQLGLNEPERID